GIASYEVGLGTSPLADDEVNFVPAVGTAHSFSSLSLSEGTKYYVTVKAINGAGIEVVASSDGVTLDTAIPNQPTGLTVVDTPNDNGGSLDLSWSASSSLDVIGYQLNYREVGQVD